METAAVGIIRTKTLVCTVFAVLFIETVLQITAAHAAEERLLQLALARLLQTGALIALIGILESGPTAFGVQGHSFLHGVKRGLCWSAGFGLAALGALGLLSAAGYDVSALLRARIPAGTHRILLFMLIGGVLAPVTEEVFFRGIIYGFFRRWGIWIALVVSTGIFLLAHPLQGGFPITQLVGGMLFAAAYEMEGNLLVPITIHCLGNLSIFSISLAF